GDVLLLVEDGKDDGQIHYRGTVTRNSASKFAVVCAATSASGTFHNDASVSATFTTYAGSLSRPRNGTGARYGVSVSISTRSCGSTFAQARSASAPRKVRVPENERQKPRFMSDRARLSSSSYE